jgi:hypothetical protein
MCKHARFNVKHDCFIKPGSGQTKTWGKLTKTGEGGFFSQQGGLAFDEELHHGDLLVITCLLFFLQRSASFIKRWVIHIHYNIASLLSLFTGFVS